MRFTKLHIYTSGVAVVGLGLLAFYLPRAGVSSASSPVFWAFVGLIVAAELLPVERKHRDATVHWTLSTPFLFALLLYKGPAWAALVGALTSLIADAYTRRRWDRVVFNAGQYVIAAAGAALVLDLLGYRTGSLVLAPFEVASLWPVLPAAAAFLVISDMLVSVAVALDQGSPILDVARKELVFSLPTNGVLLALAPVIPVLAGESLWLVGLLVIPIVGLHRGARLALMNEEQALRDPLTGLPNRALFQERLHWALDGASASSGPAVLLLDLDRFKDVNDTLGHQAGDELIRLVAQRLQDAVGEIAAVARLGGDEFAVLLPDAADSSQAVETAAGVLGILRKPMSVEGFSLDVSASIGIATYPEHGRDVDTLLQHAEVAMYVAKARGGAIEVYRADSDENSRRRLSLIHDLRKAVESRELTVAYQPKADLATGVIVGMEALVRWDHPEHGLVPPDEFIPLAERTGLIAPITAQVLEIALTDCALWHRARFALSVAVNLSPQAIYDRTLQRTATDLISKWELAAHWLELEITESTIMVDPGQAAQVLNSLADRGVRLAIDDFGTGYSSLAVLKQLPVHQLKVDRSFVKDIERDASDEAIVRTTVQLASSLGMTVCAEGVETPEAWDLLAALGCDLAQGYLLSKPMPAPDMMTWLFARVPGPETWLPSATPRPQEEGDATASLTALVPREQAT